MVVVVGWDHDITATLLHMITPHALVQIALVATNRLEESGGSSSRSTTSVCMARGVRAERGRGHG